MTPDPEDGPDDPADAAALAGYATALATGIEAHLAGWVERAVAGRYRDWSGAAALPDEVRAAAHEAGQRATTEVAPRVRALLDRDVDNQPTGPLALLRGAVVHPTAVLRQAGVPPVVRDAMAERIHPDDVYDLSPAAFADVHPDLHEPGLTWGAAKAHVVLARRRREGRR
ncbi:MAG TPA: hypothetical protein VGO60_01635 [Iamia sp.]|nr:hypothetical protein [Iamia sp.]